MGVVFVGKLVCSVNVLYMELSYTGSLDWSTGFRALSQFKFLMPVRLWQDIIVSM